MNEIIIIAAKYLIILLPILLFIAWLPLDRKTKVQFMVATILAGILAFVAARTSSLFIYNDRPFVVSGIEPLVAHDADNGFPSDHALLAVTLTAITFFFNRKVAWAMAVVTALVCIGRILAYVHNPADILGSLVIGVIASIVSFYATRHLFIKFDKRGSQSASTQQNV